ncbi:uncharacterized protein LOC127081069 [Lathyrus oleraceus]|uniref:uncharacterized protein LOC127081069 n=1 Tax=Pisum sativum TaxID=3888 RepID=UPI0021D2A10F|nr:uncharacterized protein LOC127081069 [Pisum sativum]
MGVSENAEKERVMVERREKQEVENEKEVEKKKIEEKVVENEKNLSDKRKKYKTREKKGKMNKSPTQHLPYPHAHTKKDQERKYTRFLNIFRRLQRITDEEIIQVDASYSIVIQKALPQKETNPGRVTLPITIGNVNVGKALINLDSSINLIPLSVVKMIGYMDMKHTKMTLQLADKSITRPSGIDENVLVNVDKVLFPIDFMVMDVAVNS